MKKLEAVHGLLQREVSRQEFLKFVGVGVLAIVGVTNIMNHLRVPAAESPAVPKRAVGYGYSAYGR